MVLVLSFSISWMNFVNSVLDDFYVDVHHEGVITDKWTKEEGGFLLGSSTCYYLEINDYFTVKVDHLEYYNTDIGGYRNWTTSRLK